MLAWVPSPLPDECGRSYAMRLCSSSDIAFEQKAKDLLGFLVREAGLNESLLLRLHSHLGYARFVSKEFQSVPIDQHPDRHTKPRASSLTLPIPAARYCSCCVGEDLDFWGISYWRRVHQLPGIDLCSKHGRVLTVVNRQELCHPPGQRDGADKNSLSTLDTDYVQENAVIQRFVALSDMALQNTVPVQPSTIAMALSRQARHQGIGVTEAGKGLRLSQLAHSQLPTPWIAKHFPALHAKQDGVHASSLDDVFRSKHVSHKTASYLLAMALLWDSPEQAMRECTSAGGALTTGRRAVTAVLDGASIFVACKAEGIGVLEFEVALRCVLQGETLRARSAGQE